MLFKVKKIKFHMKKKESIKEGLIKNSFWSFIAGFINRLGTLIFTIIVARILMPENYGLYSIVFSVAMVFYTFTDLGVNNAFVRYISFAISRNKKKISSYYRYLLKIKFFLAITTSLCLFILSYPLAIYVFRNSSLFLPLVAASFYIFALSFEGFYSQIFYSTNNAGYLTFREFLSQTCRIILMVFVLYFVASSYQIIGLFISLTLSSALLILFSLAYLKKLLPTIREKSDYNIDKKAVRRFIGFLTIASISSVFLSYIDSILLGLFVSPEFVGYYRAAFSLVLGIIGLTSFPNLVFLSTFTKMNSKKQEQLFSKAFKYLAVFSIPSTFALVILGKYFIRLFYGYAYLPSALPLIFLSFLILPAVCVYLCLSLFSANEKPQVFAKLILTTSILNVFLNLIFIKLFLTISPLWAVAGASIATLLSWVFYFVASFYYLKKEVGIRPPIKHILRPLVSSLIMSLFLLYYLSLFTDITILSGIGAVFLGMIIYLVSMYFLKGLTSEDLSLIKRLLRK